MALREVLADILRKLDAEVASAAGRAAPGRAQRVAALARRARELDGRVGRWGLNVTTGGERAEDLLECQDLLAEARKLGI